MYLNNRLLLYYVFYDEVFLNIATSQIIQYSIPVEAMGNSQQSLRRGESLKQLHLIDASQGLYLNRHNNRMYIKNELIISSIGDIQYELDIYTFRRLNEHYVVSVDYSSIDQQEELCSNYSSLSYFVEKQKCTLFQKTDISLKEGLPLLIHILKGFEILYEKFGYFTPSSKLVFFNIANQCKVWLHEDLKVTRNLQNDHCPKNVPLQNRAIRQIVKCFDVLRDVGNPMLRYSDFLPHQFLSFQQAINILTLANSKLSHNNQEQLMNYYSMGRNQNLISRPTTHAPHYLSPPQRITQPTWSIHPSPINSPRYYPLSYSIQPLDQKHKQNRPQTAFMNFQYQSPLKIIQQDRMKESVKLSLRNTSANTNPTQMPLHSREFTSTMPTSLKNSRILEKKIHFEHLNPYHSKKSSIQTVRECDNNLKKASQRYSEVQPTSFGRDINNQNLLGKVSLEQNSVIRHSQGSENSSPFLGKIVNRRNIQSKKTKDSTHQIHYGATLEENSVRKDFHCHKRHQTDAIVLEKMSSCQDSRLNQRSMVDGNFMNKFNLNTIKSIHLEDVDYQIDNQIIVDLKNIINKYKGRS